MNAMQVSNVVRCLSSVVFLVTCITSTLTEAASYQKTDGTIVYPIRNTRPNWDTNIHWYTGRNLEPSANLRYADLYYADLTNANLTEAYLTDANLTDANLTNASLTRVSSGRITGK